MMDKENQKIHIEYASEPDVNENNILDADPGLLSILLRDHTTEGNILWMTENYLALGLGYEENSEITIPLITGKNSTVIKPRTDKTKKEQLHRIRDKAEVFTPSWICNRQNNLVDNSWFGRPDVFNKEKKKGWITIKDKIIFSEEDMKSWHDYVLAPRMEISCGEAPYLVSRYDTTSGKMISIGDRIGLLDRKLRIVTENADRYEQWMTWSKKAVQSVYGYEWQGDNLLLARENIVLTYIDYFKAKFDGANPSIELLREIAEIVSWNLWQMDGMKFVVPGSCHEEKLVEKDWFEEKTINKPCEGCKTGNHLKHNGKYCLIKDWTKNEIITAVSLLKE
jgi:hypothetical protein